MPSTLSISPGGADNGRKRALPVLFIFGIVDIPGQKELPAGIPEHFFNPGVVRGFPVSCGKMVTRTVKMGGHQDAVMIAGLHIFPNEIVADGAVLNRQPEIFFYGSPDELRVNGAVAVRASGSGALSDTGLEVIDEVMPDAERDEILLSPGAFKMQDAGIAAFRCVRVVEAEFREIAQERAQFLQFSGPGRDHLPVILSIGRAGGKKEKSSEKEKDQTTGAGMGHDSARHVDDSFAKGELSKKL